MKKKLKELIKDSIQKRGIGVTFNDYEHIYNLFKTYIEAKTGYTTKSEELTRFEIVIKDFEQND